MTTERVNHCHDAEHCDLGMVTQRWHPRRVCAFVNCPNPHEGENVTHSTDDIPMHRVCWDAYAKLWDAAHADYVDDMASAQESAYFRSVER